MLGGWQGGLEAKISTTWSQATHLSHSNLEAHLRDFCFVWISQCRGVAGLGGLSHLWSPKRSTKQRAGTEDESAKWTSPCLTPFGLPPLWVRGLVSIVGEAFHCTLKAGVAQLNLDWRGTSGREGHLHIADAQQ